MGFGVQWPWVLMDCGWVRVVVVVSGSSRKFFQGVQSLFEVEAEPKILYRVDTF
jgi:hypothetical protein